jgi:hypothetical protein
VGNRRPNIEDEDEDEDALSHPIAINHAFHPPTIPPSIAFQHSYYAQRARTAISILTTEDKTLRNSTKRRVPYIKTDQFQTKTHKISPDYIEISKIFPLCVNSINYTRNEILINTRTTYAPKM